MITRQHVEDLLRSRADDPVLVVVRGRAAVVPRAELAGAGAETYRGAVEVVSRDDLAARLTDAAGAASPEAALASAEHRALDEIATRLDAAVTSMGG